MRHEPWETWDSVWFGFFFCVCVGGGGGGGRGGLMEVMGTGYNMKDSGLSLA